MAATLDVMSEGRLELGIGAGWMRSDDLAAGVSYDAAGERIERLAESIAVVKGSFSGEPFSFSGAHFTVRDLVGVPAAVQQPHPPLLIGGGGPRHAAPRRQGSRHRRDQRQPGRRRHGWSLGGRRELGADGGEGCVGPEGADAAGRRIEDIELSMAQWLLHVTDDRGAASTLITKMAGRLGVDSAWLDDAPGVLVGSPACCAEKLHALRERLGISYVQVHSGPRGTDLAGIGHVVAELAGT